MRSIPLEEGKKLLGGHNRGVSEKVLVREREYLKDWEHHAQDLGTQWRMIGISLK